MTHQCIGTSKLINTLVSGRNTSSYHRYDGPVDQHSPQSDFSDGAATNRYFRGVCSIQHPIKILFAKQATFSGRKKFWIHANSFTELGVTGDQRGSACWGGPPPRILQPIVNLTRCLTFSGSVPKKIKKVRAIFSSLMYASIKKIWRHL